MPLNNVARAAIEELRGLGVTDLTPDEVVRLNDLGAAQMAAGRTHGGISFVPCIECGNVILRSPSVAALDLLDRLGESVGPRAKSLLFAYLCHASGDADALRAIETPRQLERAVSAFRRHCTATKTELDNAVAVLFGEGEFKASEDLRDAILRVADFAGTRYPGFGAAIREKCLAFLRADDAKRERGDEDSDFALWHKVAVELAALTGVSPDYWFREDHRAALLAYRTATDAAAARSGAGMVAAIAGGGGSEAHEPPPEVVAAIAEMRRTIAEIYTARKERNHGKRKQGS